MPDPIVLMSVTTSIDSIARQYLASTGCMPIFGANHLSSFRLLAVLFECVNAGGLAPKKAELHKINVATWKALHLCITEHSTFLSQIKVPCRMNGTSETLVWSHLGGENGSVELSLAGRDGRSVTVEGIKNFNDLCKRLDQELQFDNDIDISDINSDGEVNSSVEMLVQYDFDESFEFADDSESFEDSEPLKDSNFNKASDAHDSLPYESYVSGSCGSAGHDKLC